MHTWVVGALACAAVPVAGIPAVGTGWSVALDIASVALSTLFITLLIPHLAPSRRPAWRMLHLALVVSLAAEVLFRCSQLQSPARWPSPADLLYGLSYLPLALGLLRLDRQRGGRLRLGGLLDTLIVTVSTAAMALVFLVLPMVSAGLLSRTGQLVSSLYVLFDVVIVFLALRLLGTRTPAVWLLVTGLVELLAGDVGEQVAAASTASILFPRWMNLLWLAFYLCVALAALAAVRTDGRWPGPDREILSSPVSWFRLVAMTVAAGLPAAVVVLPGEDSEDESVALGVAAAILLGLVLARFWDLHRQLDRRARELTAMAGTDPLTGVANRRTWDTRLALLTRGLEGGTTASVLVGVLDLDHFKQYNDTRGHVAGDDLLRRAARAWSVAVGPGGVLARWGGEEFVVALTCDDLAEGHRRLDALRGLVPDGQTVSLGIARWHGDNEEVVRRADAALYRAKQEGRDRAVVAELAPH